MIIPSIIATTQEEFYHRFTIVKSFASIIHLDVMDGVFVEHHSLDFEMDFPQVTMQAHLMVEHPVEYIKKYGNNFDLIFFHIESVDSAQACISAIEQQGAKIGMAINPNTEVNEIASYLDQLDAVLVMSVQPGSYGATYVPKVLPKIATLKNLTSIPIYVDGHMNETTIPEAMKMGATNFTVGSLIQNSEDPQAVYKQLCEVVHIKNE